MKRKLILSLKILLTTGLSIIICGLVILFATPYGHQLRTIAAETILTSQHRQYAQLLLLPKAELDAILQNIYSPKTINSDDAVNSLSQKELDRRKSLPLSINVETVKQKFDDHYYEGKLMTISNPLNVKLVNQQGTQGADVGEKIYVMAQREKALAAVNASGFVDETGVGGGAVGIGIVIADGKIINTPKDENSNTVIAGLTKYGEMITGDYSAKQLINKGVVSAAGFMPQLIVKGEKMITSGNGGWGYGPRTIMAQKKDGTLMFLVIDGRQTHSIGASIKDCQDLLYEKGAYNAMAMDGGASATLYAMGDIINVPATKFKSRYLPNAWVVTANPNQKVSVTIDGQAQPADKISEITGLAAAK
ncbi:phosphodiester glycosidase family protein [Ectobacillus sp. sgz5001026]|jgi:exopolysaccharide biosynthesis protein|uniref:phosphodiester glycosidase family protein n=1 Tax=Ectobacillus sp. sgz5001026 TaxID=3242473 RepID=UPI0036D35323